MSARADRSRGRRGTAVIVSLSLAVLACVFSPAALAAGSGRPFLSSFGSFTGSDPQAIAVDRSNGDIYVANTANNTVERFDSSGNAKNFTAGPDSGTNTLTGFAFDSGPSAVEIAIDRSGGPHDGYIYVANGFGGNVKVYSNDGTPVGNITGDGTAAGSFNEPCGVAVDQSNGNVYIGDYGARVWRYTPTGPGLSESDYSGGIDPGFNPCQVAADNGNVWAADWDNTGPVKRFSASDFTTGAPPSPAGSTVDTTAKALATDHTTGDLYVDEGDTIHVFDTSDTSLYTFGSSSDFSGSAGVGVMGANGNAYVADPTGHQIDIYGPYLGAVSNSAKAVTKAVSVDDLSDTAVTLRGRLVPGNDPSITDCHFDWVSDTQFQIDGFASANTTPCAEGNSFTAAADVHADLTGLNPNTTYHFRLNITGSTSGDVLGSDMTFTTFVLQPRTIARTIGSPETLQPGGDFSTPGGIAINTTGSGGVPAGTFYVVDTSNLRIQRFSPSGQFVAAWGWGVRNGSAEYQICTDAPTCQRGIAGGGSGQIGSAGAGGVAVDPSTGAVYVQDSNFRIDVFSASGTVEGAFGWGVADGASQLEFCTVTCKKGLFGDGDGQLGRFLPDELTVDSSGKLYFADSGNKRVEVFQPTISGGAVTGAGFDTNITGGFGVPSLPGPDGVAVDSAGDLFVLDSSQLPNNPGNNRIEEFDSSFNPIATNYAASPLTSVFGSGVLVALSMDANDHLFVLGTRAANSNRFAVAELDSNGSLLSVHGADMTANDPTQGPGMAVAPASLGGNLYVASNNVGILEGVYVLSDAIPKMGPVTVHAGTTATFSGTVASKGFDTTYHFEYSTDGQSWTAFPTRDADAGTDPGNIPVSQDVTGLVGSDTYHVRLVQDRGDAGGGSATSAETTFSTDPAAPDITDAHFSDLSDTGVTLRADVNPESQSASYHFEYADDADFQANGWANAQRVPASDASLASGSVPVAVSRFVAGLSPSTVYHWRLVASNGTGTTDGAEKTLTTFDSGPGSCPNAQFRVGPSANLPDCRAYELVTPADSGGIFMSGEGLQNHAVTADGNSLAYATRGQDLPSFQGNGFYDLFVASRRSNGWQSSVTAPDGSQSVLPELRYVSPDLAYSDWDTTNSADQGTLGPTGAGGGGTWLRLPDGSFQHTGIGSLGASPNACVDQITSGATHVIFQTGCSDDATASLEPGAPQSGAIYDRTPGGATHLVSVLPGGTPSTGSYVGSSADGSAVVFSAAGEYYVRVNNTATLDLTSVASTYEGIAGDGSAVFYLNGGDLYRYDVANQTSSQITSAGDVTVVNIPEDGHHAYFTSRHALAAGGVSGQDNLYYWDGSPNPGFIGVLNPDDLTTALDSFNDAIPSLAHWTDAITGHATQPALDTSRTTPDGTSIAFQSEAQLTSFDNAGRAEIYLFKIGDTAPICVSCDPNGQTPNSDAQFLSPTNGGARGTSAVVPNLSSDGRTVTFETSNALVSADSNGMQDVYRWTRGRGIGLISSGTSSKPTYLYDVTPTAGDIFLLTHQQLVPNDFNAGAPAIYDARVNGGIASQFTSPPAACAGDACQGKPTPPPAPPVVGSVSFPNPGNLKPGASSAKPGVLTRTVHGATFLIKVRVPAKGLITISGTDVHTVQRSVSKAGTYMLRAGLTAKEKRLLARRRKLELELHVAYAPASGQASAVMVSLTVRPAIRHVVRRAVTRNQGGAR
jgi:DNA-binding beta-propeller fold protein YncE